MRCVVHGSAASFLERSLPWLLEREEENNLILGIALARRDDPPLDADPAWFLTVEDGGQVVGAAFRTPPHMVGLTRIPEGAVPLVVRMVGQAFREVPGVVGPEAQAAAFARVWCAGRDLRAHTEMRMGVQALHTLTPTDRIAPGRMRPAGPGDREGLVSWMAGFEADTGIFSTGAAGTVDRLLRASALRVWEVEGVPVAMAGTSGVTPHGVRIGYVYTPPDHRGSGYATALTTALTAEMLSRGYRFCVLYVDLEDPVATGIYRRLGYRPVTTAVSIRFVDGNGAEDVGPGREDAR